MPYIVQERRVAIDGWLHEVYEGVAGTRRNRATADHAGRPRDCGELNYALTMTCIQHGRANYGTLDACLYYIGRIYLTSEPLRYQRINDMIGAYHGAALELLRRRPTLRYERVTLDHLASRLYVEIGVGYEMQKIAENGDIDYGEAADRQTLAAKRDSKS